MESLKNGERNEEQEQVKKSLVEYAPLFLDIM